MIELNLKPVHRELRTFAFGSVPFALFIGGLRWWKTGSPTLLVVLLAISLLVAVTGWIRPQLLRWVYVAWMVVLFPVAWVMSHLVLAVVYFGILTPIGWMRRVLGTNEFPMHGDASTTYWVNLPPARPPGEEAFRQF